MNKRNLLIASIMAAVLVLLGAVPEEGYAATGMKVTQGSGKSPETADGGLAVQMLEDIETAAETEGSSYDIHYYTDGGTLSGDYVKSYQYNVGATLPDEDNIKKEGYSFLGWWDGKSVVSKIAKTDTEDKDLYALWQCNSSTVMTAVNELDVEEVDVDAKEVSLVSTATNKNTGYYYSQLSDLEKRLYHTLYNVYKFTPSEKKIQYDGCLDITAAEKITRANAISAGKAMELDHPEIYWISGFGVYTFNNERKIRFSPYKAYSTYLADAKMYDDYFQSALNAIGINSRDRIYTSVRKINDYIVREYSYDYLGYTLNDKTSNDTRSVGRMLTGKIGCCEGYAKLAKIFCDYYGIECILVHSATHVWNQVQLYGEWYTLDVTWNEDKKSGKGTSSTNDYLLAGLSSTRAYDTSNEHTVIKNNYNDTDGKPITDYAYFNVPALSTIDFDPSFGPTICPIPPDCPAKNTVMTNDSLKYKVTKSSPKNGTVSVIGVKSKKIAKATIPASVMFYGYIFKVTEIGPKAFKGCKKLKSVTVGKNIKKIGSKAFYQDKKLKKITVKSKKLKTVGKNALKGIGKKAVIKVPKAKKKAYKKLMNRKTGFGKATKLK